MPTKTILRPALITAAVLLIPFFGNMYVAGWNWGWQAFVLAGGMLFGAGLTYELVAKKMNAKAYRFAVGLAVVTALVLTWVNMAVGIIGSEDNPANLLYFALLLVGLIGAFIARFRPARMARTLFAMALGLILIPVVALIFWRSDFAPGVAPVFALNAVFAMLFVASGLLFQHAARHAATT